MNAGAMLKQAQVGMDGVYYLHHGWQNMVDSLKKRTEAVGVTFVKGKVISIIIRGDQVDGVLLSNDERIDASSAIAAFHQMRHFA